MQRLECCRVQKHCEQFLASAVAHLPVSTLNALSRALATCMQRLGHYWPYAGDDGSQHLQSRRCRLPTDQHEGLLSFLQFPQCSSSDSSSYGSFRLRHWTWACVLTCFPIFLYVQFARSEYGSKNTPGALSIAMAPHNVWHNKWERSS